ncbi:MAG: cobalamin B12-binding domain-containing protein [Promethearchaeota archaeon]|jgi:5-methyltetrahydrofolate--homocysteine methyltransferase
MTNLKTLEDLKIAVLEGDDDLARDLAEKSINDGIEPVKVMNEGIIPGIVEAGELWKTNEYFQTDIILCAEAFRLAMEYVEPKLSSGDLGTSGTVIIGTVAGDMHNLGKIMVKATLRSGGFNVIDLGEDVPTATFIAKVKELKPDILGLGCYMTTTMLEMKEILGLLQNEGLRNDVKVLVGGVPTTQEFADEVGADAWGKDAFDAVEKAKKILGV